MIPHPPTWDTLLASGAAFRPQVRAKIYQAGGSPLADLEVQVVSGFVQKDASFYPRSRATIVTADRTAFPGVPNPWYMAANIPQDWLAIDYGYTDAATGTTAYIRIHDGPITRTTVDQPAGLLTIESADPSVLIAGDEKPICPYTYTSGAVNAAQNLQDIAKASFAATTVTNTLTGSQLSVTVPADWTWSGSPWAAMEYLADLMGAEMYFDSNRNMVLRPIPDAGSPVFTFRTGETGTITEYQQEQTRSYNVVYLVYGSAGAEVVGSWADPSFTSTFGSGRGIVRTVINQYIGTYTLMETRTGTPTQAQADAAALAYAKRVRGMGRNTPFRAVPVPWLEPGDTITVKTIEQPAETVILQSVSIPLGLDSMNITTRNPTYLGPM